MEPAQPDRSEPAQADENAVKLALGVSAHTIAGHLLYQRKAAE